MKPRALFGRYGASPEPSSSITEDSTAFNESLRVLRSNLDVALTDIDHPTVIVTSANPAEGKTAICANLALAFAAAGRKVVLVDLDLRHPDAHRRIGAHNEFGVSDVLLGERPLDESLQFIELPGASNSRLGIYFLATGHQVANPTELLGTSRTARMLERLAAQSDIVLLDTPPVLPVADTLVISRAASGAILVTESRRTAGAAVRNAKDLLIRNQTRLLGVVLNKFQRRDASFGYGYGYGYVSQSSDDRSMDEDKGTFAFGNDALAGQITNGTRGRESDN